MDYWYKKFQNMIQVNKNYNESNLKTMSRMQDCFVDLTVTSPPYDNLRDYKGFSFDFKTMVKELFRVTKKGGVVVWVVGDATINGSETGTSFKQALYFMKIGFNLHDTMIYHKINPIPIQNNRYQPAFEFMFVFSKENLKTFNPLLEKTIHNGLLKKYNLTAGNKNEKKSATRNLGVKAEIGYNVKETKFKQNVFSYLVGAGQTTNDMYAFEHTAIFPEQLVQDHIKSWSNELDLVYDPFMGSGTTAKMAILNERKWIGSEISSEYCKIIGKRVESAYREAKTLFTL